MFDRFSSGARKLMGIARAEASDLGHDFIYAEHLLLGILADKGSAGTVVLRAVGQNPEKVRKRILKLMPGGKKGTYGGQLPFTPRARTVLEVSLAEAEAYEKALEARRQPVLSVTVEEMKDPTLGPLIKQAIGREAIERAFGPGGGGIAEVEENCAIVSLLQALRKTKGSSNGDDAPENAPTVENVE